MTSTSSPTGLNGPHPSPDTVAPGMTPPSPWARPGGEPPTGTASPTGVADPQGQTAWVPSGTLTTTGWMPPSVGASSGDPQASGWVPAPVVPADAPMPAPVPADAPMPAPVQPAPMPAPTLSTPVRRRTATARLVDGLLVISLVVAAGGIGYAIGHQTAPATSTGGAGNRDLSAFGGFGNGPTGQLPGTGTSTQGTTAQVAAPSGAPVVPEGTTAPTTEGEPPATEAPPDPGRQRPGGGFAPGGFGGGGPSGTVSAVDPTAITVTTADGSELQVTTTDTTTYHQQVAASADAITVGSPVRITSPGTGGRGGFGGPAASVAPDARASVATEVELLAEAPAADTGGRGGRLGGWLTGTVTAIDDASISITTADGQTMRVAVDDATSWVQQTVVTRDAVTPGVSVRFSIEGGSGGPGQGQAQGQPSAGGPGGPFASLTVSDVEVLLPAA